MKSSTVRLKRCLCGVAIVWAKDDAGRWVDVVAQGSIDRTAPDPVVLWSETGDRAQHASRLDDFERAHGPYRGVVWYLHFPSCRQADQAIPMAVTRRGRERLELLATTRATRGGSA